MKTWMALGIYFLAGTACFAQSSVAGSDLPREGFFLGLGGAYNSMNLNQNAWGKGISNIQTSTGTNSNGVAAGTSAPFNYTGNSLAPVFQAGYFKHIGDKPNIVGVKFFYEYLDSTATDTNVFIPQLGHTTNASTGAVSSLYGYVNATSVQPSVSKQFTLLLFAGRTFGGLSLYVGVGPSLVNLSSKNYYSIGYAEFEGVTLNVTGLVSYASPSLWVLGGTGQIGANYFINPSWFIDLSYGYTVTGSTTTSHQQTFTNTSSVGGVAYTTSGTLYTKNTMRVKNQTLMFTINKMID